MNTDGIKPLDGIRVVALEHAIAAPFCTRQLADMGATVIKVELPDAGDFARHYDKNARGMSSYFVWANRSKKSLTLNIKQQEGKEILDRLLLTADVFVQNLAPGATDRLGLSFKALHDKFPKLIVCNISGYGASGPYQLKKAYDLMIQSESGFLSLTGFPGAKYMAKAGISLADICTGMYGYSNILAALIQRQKTQLGSEIDLSMFECMTEWMSAPLYYSMDDKAPPERTGANHATICPNGMFMTKDSKVFILGIQNTGEWQTFCKQVLRMPEMSDDPRFDCNVNRNKNRDELLSSIEGVFAQMDWAEVENLLNQAHIAYSAVNTMGDIWHHPQLKARQRWVEIDTPVGKMPSLLPPGVNNSFTPSMNSVPALGEHTKDILHSLGYGDTDIETLKNEFIV